MLLKPPQTLALAAVDQSVATLQRALRERRDMLEFKPPAAPDDAARFQV